MKVGSNTTENVDLASLTKPHTEEWEENLTNLYLKGRVQSGCGLTLDELKKYIRTLRSQALEEGRAGALREAGIVEHWRKEAKDHPLILLDTGNPNKDANRGYDSAMNDVLVALSKLRKV